MTICEYCGKPAPLFKKHHPRCEEKFNEARDSIIRVCQWVVRRNQGMDSLPNQLQSAVGVEERLEGKLRQMVIESWEQSASDFLAAHLLSRGEENVLQVYRETFDLNEEELDRNGMYSRVKRSALLRTLIEGHLPESGDAPAAFADDLQKGEEMVFHFPRVERYHSERVTEIQSVPEGSSIRIRNGQYVKPDSFGDRRIDRLGFQDGQTGEAALTNRGLRFRGGEDDQFIRLQEIAGLIGFVDGTGLVFKEAGKGSDYYVTGDGWFTYNLMDNLLRVVKLHA